MTPELTPEQRAAVEAPQAQVLVSAGAGSGKTRLLVERYLTHLLAEGVPLEDLPAVTFTRKAAAELTERIRMRLLEAYRADLAWSLDAAPIGTIHGLCSRIVRAHAPLAGVAPDFRVVDEDQAAILHEEVWQEVWAAAVLAATPDELAILASLGDGFGRDLKEVYAALRQAGVPVPRLELPAPTSVATSRARLETVLLGLDGAVRSSSHLKTVQDNLELAAACWEALTSVDPGEECLADFCGLYPGLRCGAQAKPAFEELVEALGEFRAALAAREAAAFVALADKLLVAFGEAYTARKAALGVLDFSDLELAAVELLERGVVPFGPGARLLVDEFQDTNDLQCRILDGLGTGAVFVVGDYHQSIYAFRGADPRVFRERRSALESHARQDGAALSLAQNFRSREPVVAAINHVFSADSLFGPGFPPLVAARLGEADEGALGRTLPPAAEVLVFDDGIEEARGVAARIDRLVHGEGWRAGDIVILLRAFSAVEEYETALQELGIPVYVIGGRGYYAREEVADLVALLTLLVNPCDDRALLTVLRSPLAGLSDDALFHLRDPRGRSRRGDGDGATSLWEALEHEETWRDVAPRDQQRLRAFSAVLTGLRRRVGRPGLDDLLREAVESFAYDVVVLGAPGGRARYANLRKLMVLASEYEEVEGPDLAGFVRHLRSLETLRAREGDAAILAENEDVVRIMTIHQAKGLEFPLVVLADLGRAPRRNRTPRFVVGRGGRVAVDLKHLSRERKDPRFVVGPAEELLAERREMEAEEEQRLVYVAMTRARERLVLSGAKSPARDQGGDECRDALSQLLAALGRSVLEPGEIVRPVQGLDLVVERVADAPPQGPAGGTAELGLAAGAAVEPLAPPPDTPTSRLTSALVSPRSWVADRELRASRGRLDPAGTGVERGGIERVSFSALADYARCPRRYYVERLLGLRLDGALDEGPELPRAAGGQDDAPSGRLVGTLVHRVLEQATLEAPLDLGHLSAIVGRVLGDKRSVAVPAPGAALVGEPTEGPLVERVLALTAAFWESPVASWSGLVDAGREVPFLFERRGTLVEGVMDLVLRGPDGWRVVDYKTNRLEGTAVSAVLEGYELQARVYALAALECGAPAVSVGFLLLADPAHLHELHFGPADRASLEGALDAALEGLESGRFDVLGDDCAACGLSRLCRALAPPDAQVGARP